MRSTTTMAYTDSGTGESALLYLPGWCGGREVFSPLLACTAQTRRSVSVDWRGHGASPGTAADFGSDKLIEDAIELIRDLRLHQVVPVALSHAGWVALELRRRLGAELIPAVVLLDWMPLGAPPGFTGALQALQNPQAWSATRAQLFGLWSAGVDNADVLRYVDSMSAYGFPMWSRAGREIFRSFSAQPTRLAEFAALAASGPPCPTAHLYAQPRDNSYLSAQQAFAAEHEWFHVHRLPANSHFPCLEVPAETASAINDFLAGVE
jgi:pimeloyl-ACP methyl ester carboxylesterase